WISVGTASGLIVVAIAVYSYLAHAKWEKASYFGALGDAIGPFAGLATALALGAAIYATILQREELRLQREELKAHREAAQESAAAQERLARSQEDLALAQRDANDLTTKLVAEQKKANDLVWFQELAQRRANLATLTAQVANADVAATSASIQEF